MRLAAKAVMAAVQGPRTALLFFKLDCEAAIGEAEAVDGGGPAGGAGETK